MWSTTLSPIYFSRVNRCNEYRIEKSGCLDVLQNGDHTSVETKTRFKGHFRSHSLHMALLWYFFSLDKHTERGEHEVLRAHVLLTHTQQCHGSQCFRTAARLFSGQAQMKGQAFSWPNHRYWQCIESNQLQWPLPGWRLPETAHARDRLRTPATCLFLLPAVCYEDAQFLNFCLCVFSRVHGSPDHSFSVCVSTSSLVLATPIWSPPNLGSAYQSWVLKNKF